MNRALSAAIGIILVALSGTPLLAGSHADLVIGTFKNGPEVTKACLGCHEQQAKDFMKTPHWTWSEEQVVNGKKMQIGKANVINNFCIALPGNYPRCTSCHAGYGWKDKNFDFTKAESVDCLVCHDTTGTYKKFPSGAGHPVYEGETKEFPKGKVWKPVDLGAVARGVGKASRATCGACHFYGGGGDHVKHGDLDSSLINPTPEIDVHMGKGMSCQDCHKTSKHVISGESMLISQGDGVRVRCTDCHSKKIHKNQALNRHTGKVACQTCHIRTIAKALPTKVWWDWSKAGEERATVPKDKFGEKTFDKMKGEFRWDKEFAPSYYWYNGSSSRVLPGDKVQPGTVVALNKPLGKRSDKNAVITPFKVMRGKQPYDAENRYMVYISLFGPKGYWSTYDWNSAIDLGMKTAGLPFSGKYDFIETSMVWKVNHMVGPKNQALKCDECHGKNGRMDWKALGYKKDPRSRK